MAMKTLNPNPNLALFLLATSAFILILAQLIEQWFGAKSCRLCLLERIPYYLIIAFALIQLLLSRNGAHLFFIWCYRLVFLGSALLALYHVATERGWLQEPITCSTLSIGSNTTLEEIKRHIHANSLSCKEVSWRFLGLSMAELNLLWSCTLVFILFKLKEQEKLCIFKNSA